METDPVHRFVHALSPASRDQVQQLSPEQRERMAAAWEQHLNEDTDLLSVSELDPAAAEHEVAERVVRENL
ncbi:hypothetical protein ACIHEJ_40595 [Streptomyces sp. NPDC052301]|uniref:hypothetical protein n=1 Tax=Streptomyces sp. NPDC052301 TaxID=3365687 RepID=UPI0037D82981